MRALSVVALAAATLAACTDADPPTGPGTMAPPRPDLSVVIFGFTPLNDQASISDARRVNDLGQVMGAHQISSTPAIQRTYLYESGAIRDLPVTPGATSGGGQALNATGMVVGAIDGQAAAWVESQPSLLPTGLETTNHSSIASAVNNLGQIVGTDFDALAAETAVLFWDGADDPSPTQVPLTGGTATPWSINDAGVIVGGTINAGLRSAIVWPSPSSPPQTLKGFDGGPCQSTNSRDEIVAYDINQRGEIVGACVSATGIQHAAFWSSADAIAIDLDPAGRFEGRAGDINDQQQIVGGSDFTPVLWMREGGSFRPFQLGTSAGVVTDLNNTGHALGGSGGDWGFWTIPLRAELDVLPGVANNRVKLDGRGTISVAVLGSRWLQVAGIDPMSLTFGNDDGQETAVAMKKKLTPVVTLTDRNGDGVTDLMAEFDERALMANGDLALGTATLVLLGRFRDGKHLRGAGIVQAVR